MTKQELLKKIEKILRDAIHQVEEPLREEIERRVAETQSRQAAEQLNAKDKEIERLRAELSWFQESEFHLEWPSLKATRDSLKEQLEEVRKLQLESASLAKVKCPTT
jgi:hypothetical protein